MRIGIGRDGNRELNTTPSIRERPVHDLASNQRLVGNDHLSAILTKNGAGAKSDALNLTREPADLDAISQSHRAFEHEHEASDEVRDDALKTKPHTDAECTRDECELAGINAENGE